MNDDAYVGIYVFDVVSKHVIKNSVLMHVLQHLRILQERQGIRRIELNMEFNQHALIETFALISGNPSV